MCYKLIINDYWTSFHNETHSCITLNLQRAWQTHLCKDGSSSLSCSGSLVLGTIPMMVLFSEVPFSSLLFTNCMFLAVSTLILMVEPGNSTPSWVHSKGSRVGIWIPLLDDIVQKLDRRLKFKACIRSELGCKERLHRMTNWDKWKQEVGTTACTLEQFLESKRKRLLLWKHADCCQMYTVFSLFVVCFLSFTLGTRFQKKKR